MTDDSRDSGTRAANPEELKLEALTMALYVAVVLFAELTVLSRDVTDTDPKVIALIWGSALGLALAHIFAFSVAAGPGSLSIHLTRTWLVGLSQLAGASIIALGASIPILVFPSSFELEATELLLAGFIGVVGYLVSRRSGRTRGRSLLYSGVVVIVGIGVALLKNTLNGH